MAESICTQSLQVCGVRVAKLDAQGYPLQGAGNGYIGKAPMDATLTLDYLNGAQLQQLQGCGYLNGYFHAPNVLREVTLTMNLTDNDSELLEIITWPDTTIIAESGNTIGRLFPPVGACALSNQVGVSIEIFTKRWFGCEPPTDGLYYWQWVLPRMFMHSTTMAMKNDFMELPVEGYGNSNPNWGLGPWNDAPTPVTTVGAVFACAALPTAVCGVVAVPYGSPS
jgi:hypothetical protein